MDSMNKAKHDHSPLPWQSARMFYLAPEKWEEPYLLEGAEAQHLSKVLRIKTGEQIRLMDGAGREGLFAVLGISKHTVQLECLDVWTHPKPTHPATLAVAWTKSARRSWLLEKAVEFEAAAVWFWQAERSQFPVPETAKEGWQEQCVAGAKQCRNPWLPDVHTMPGGVEQLIKHSQGISNRFVLLEEDHKPSAMLGPDMLAQQGQSLYVIGPEGGLSATEARLLIAAGFVPVSLGKRVLRWETAALLCLGLHWWQGQLPYSNSQLKMLEFE